MAQSRTTLPCLILAALLVLCFGLGARVDRWFQNWPGNRIEPGNLLSILIGDARRMFARHFSAKADAYFHSGFYPSIFDERAPREDSHLGGETHEDSDHHEDEHEDDGHDSSFLGKPKDWIDAFGRKFYPSAHTHLDAGGAHAEGAKNVELGNTAEVREILPWLRLSAELDPHDIRTYTVAAYWLRNRMGRDKEAEEFLREGLRANPGSYEILFELGRVFEENRHDPARARNVWEAALRHWNEQESQKEDPDSISFIQIASHLALLEQKQGNLEQAISCMKLWKSRSPNPDEVQKRIDELMEASQRTHAR